MEDPAKARRESFGQDFLKQLPAELGEPFVMSTFDHPFIFVAFYKAQKHEMADGRFVNGNEFRLLSSGTGFHAKKLLAGILGVDSEYRIVCMALKCSQTRANDLKPYTKTLRSMWAEAIAQAA